MNISALSLAILFVTAVAQIAPLQLMNSIMSAVPYYQQNSQNSFDPNLFSLLLMCLGNTFHYQSNTMGMPQAYNLYSGAFQNAVQNPQPQFTHIYNQMYPQFAQQCCAQPNALLSLLPLILNQHGNDNGNWATALAQQLLMSLQNHHHHHTSGSNSDSSSESSDSHHHHNNNGNNQLILQLMQMIMSHDHDNSNNQDITQIITMLVQLISQMNHCQDPNGCGGNGSGSGSGGTNNDNALILQLLTQLQSQHGNAPPYLPVVVGTTQDSIYDTLLSFLSQQAANHHAIGGLGSSAYSTLLTWLQSHHGSVSSSALEEILFWLLHTMIPTSHITSGTSTADINAMLASLISGGGSSSSSSSSYSSSSPSSYSFSSSTSDLQQVINSLSGTSSASSNLGGLSSSSTDANLQNLLNLLGSSGNSGAGSNSNSNSQSSNSQSSQSYQSPLNSLTNIANSGPASVDLNSLIAQLGNRRRRRRLLNYYNPMGYNNNYNMNNGNYMSGYGGMQAMNSAQNINYNQYPNPNPYTYQSNINSYSNAPMNQANSGDMFASMKDSNNDLMSMMQAMMGGNSGQGDGGLASMMSMMGDGTDDSAIEGDQFVSEVDNKLQEIENMDLDALSSKLDDWELQREAAEAAEATEAKGE